MPLRLHLRHAPEQDVGRIRAVIVARWAEDRVLLELPDGDVRIAPVPAALNDGFEVGQRADVELDDEGRVASWSVRADEPPPHCLRRRRWRR